MTKLSRKPVDPGHLGQFINNFWDGATLLSNKDEVKTFLRELLSHTETKMFAKRLQVAKMLLEGYDYLTIGNFVKVTAPTIAKMNNTLHTGGGGLKAVVSHLQRLEEKREHRLRVLDPESLENLKRRYAAYFWPMEIIAALGGCLRRAARRRSVG